jgi:hypothetical protein
MMRASFTLLTILVVIALLLCSTSRQLIVGGASADTSSPQAGWRLELEEGKTARSTLTIKNRCSEPHLFRVKGNVKYLQFEQPPDSVLIAAGSNSQLGVRFDATRLKRKLYRSEVIIECRDCKGSKCTQDRDKVPVELNVVGPTSKPTPLPDGPRPAGRTTGMTPTGPAVNVKLLFKWGGILTPGGGGGCNTPLGICITRGFALDTAPLTKVEIKEGFGTATFQVEGEQLHMVFHREAALPDGTIHINRDKYLEPDLSAALGYGRIMLKAGVYRVDMSKERFGETFVDVVKEGGTSPTAIHVVTCYRYAHTTGNCKGCGVSCDDGNNYPMNCSADIFSDMKPSCGGMNVAYDPDVYGPVKVFKNDTRAYESFVLAHREHGIVETFDSLGTKSSCATSPAADAGTVFTLLIPRLKGW